MNREKTELKKEIARDCVKGLNNKDGLYDEGQVAVACMSAIDKWDECVFREKAEVKG